jgi:hypothetical protein
MSGSLAAERMDYGTPIEGCMIASANSGSTDGMAVDSSGRGKLRRHAAVSGRENV